MFKTLPRSITAAAAALAIALSGLTLSAVPARADTNDTARILAGIAALYAIGRAIDIHNDRQERANSANNWQHQPPRGHHGGPGRPRGPGYGHPRPNPYVAPARCFTEGTTLQGRYYRGYRARCMQRNVVRPQLLPQQCLREIQTERGWRNIYGGRCLAQNGWQREAGFRP